MKKKVLLTSGMIIMLCICLIAGSTYALFTASETESVVVSAGNVELSVAINDDDAVAYSLDEDETNRGTRNDNVFANGGTFSLDGNGLLTIERMTPGDYVTFGVDVTNESNVAIQYRLVAKSLKPTVAGEKDLADKLTVTITGLNGDARQTQTLVKPATAGENVEWVSAPFTVAAPASASAAATAISSFNVTVTFDDGGASYGTDGVLTSSDNDYMNKTANLQFVIEAVQGNGEFPSYPNN